MPKKPSSGGSKKGRSDFYKEGGEGKPNRSSSKKGSKSSWSNGEKGGSHIVVEKPKKRSKAKKEKAIEADDDKQIWYSDRCAAAPSNTPHPQTTAHSFPCRAAAAADSWHRFGRTRLCSNKKSAKDIKEKQDLHLAGTPHTAHFLTISDASTHHFDHFSALSGRPPALVPCCFAGLLSFRPWKSRCLQMILLIVGRMLAQESSRRPLGGGAYQSTRTQKVSEK